MLFPKRKYLIRHYIKYIHPTDILKILSFVIFFDKKAAYKFIFLRELSNKFDYKTTYTRMINIKLIEKEKIGSR